MQVGAALQEALMTLLIHAVQGVALLSALARGAEAKVRRRDATIKARNREAESDG